MRKLGRVRLPAQYRYTEDFEPEDWAWEFLRRDPDYEAASRSALAGSAPPPDPAVWGLHCCCGCQSQGR